MSRRDQTDCNRYQRNSDTNREELNNKISNVEDEGKLRATEFYQVLTEGCQKNKQEVVDVYKRQELGIKKKQS